MRRFEAVGKLGEGAFGVALLVRNRVDGSAFAVKRVATADVDAGNAALAEARLLSGLSHAGVVRYYESFVEEG